jgi:hypothetical protein
VMPERVRPDTLLVDEELPLFNMGYFSHPLHGIPANGFTR